MAVVVIGRIAGDADALLAALERIVDPVFADVAPRKGAISHLVARTAGGLVYVDVWESAEGHRAATRDRRILDALARAGITAAEEPEVLELVYALP
jgi:hypothetical protein